jgi:hypothetical protein
MMTNFLVFPFWSGVLNAVFQALCDMPSVVPLLLPRFQYEISTPKTRWAYARESAIAIKLKIARTTTENRRRVEGVVKEHRVRIILLCSIGSLTPVAAGIFPHRLLPKVP